MNDGMAVQTSAWHAAQSMVVFFAPSSNPERFVVLDEIATERTGAKTIMPD